MKSWLKVPLNMWCLFGDHSVPSDGSCTKAFFSLLQLVFRAILSINQVSKSDLIEIIYRIETRLAFSVYSKIGHPWIGSVVHWWALEITRMKTHFIWEVKEKTFMHVSLCSLNSVYFMEQQNGNVLAFQIYTLLANWPPLAAFACFRWQKNKLLKIMYWRNKTREYLELCNGGINR